MDFTDYLTARHSTLVRTAALLGCPEDRAGALVASVLSRGAREIGRSRDPDPQVYRRLVAVVLEQREQWSGEDRLPAEDHDNGVGLGVRRVLQRMEPDTRVVTVLALFADLTVPEAADAGRQSRAATSTKVSDGAALLAGSTSPGIQSQADQSRELLLAAAETIEVTPPEGIVPNPPARRWPWLAATAAVGAVAATLLLGHGSQGDTQPTLEADQVPSLFGYDADGARDLLEARGLQVTEEDTAYCDVEGRVIDSDPPTGDRFSAGDPVTLYTAHPSADCPGSYLDRIAAWAFVDFANGRGPAPAFADKVSIVIDGSYPATMTEADAANPNRWGGFSPLTEIRAVSSRVVRGDDASYVVPHLSAETIVPPAHYCGVSEPIGSGERPALALSLHVDAPGQPECPLVVDLFRSSEGIDAIVMYTEKSHDQ